MQLFHLPPVVLPDWLVGEEGIPVRHAESGQRVHLPVFRESMLLVGQTGYAKTTLIQQYLEVRLQQESPPFTVFLDVKQDFRRYLRPGEQMVSFSPLSGHTQFQWNLIKELRQSSDPEAALSQMADRLFTDLSNDQQNAFWREAAKAVFMGHVRTILYCYTNNPSNGVLVRSLRGMNRQALIEHLGKYGPNRWIISYYLENGTRLAGDILAFVAAALQKFVGPFCSENGTDTIHDYLAGQHGTRLLLAYDIAQSAASSAFFRILLGLIIQERLSQTVDRAKSVLLVLDEAPVLEGDFGLLHAATVGRGNGLQILLATQSLEKMVCLAPERHGEALMHACLAGFPVVAAFHPPGDASLDTLNRLFGSRTAIPLSRYDSPGAALEAVVTPGEFARMGVGEFYLKRGGSLPIKFQTIV